MCVERHRDCVGPGVAESKFLCREQPWTVFYFHYTMENVLAAPQEWMKEVAEKGKNLTISAGHEPGTDLGPVISPESKKRILGLIESAKKEVW